MTVEAYIKNHPSDKAIIESINTLLLPLNIKVDEIIKNAQSVKYKLNLPLDLMAQKKIMREEKAIKYAISSALGSSDFIYSKDAKSVYFEVKSDDFEIVKFNDLKDVCISNSLNLVLGKDENGNKIFTNLSKAPHILVGGATGSGKSELLHAFIASLIVGMPYTAAEIAIIDPKRSEYSVYRNRKHITLITEVDEALSCLNHAVNIMEERYAELERSYAKDIYKYTGTMDMHPLVIIIDELADLILTHPEVEKPIVRIAQKARACGIHLIIGTQSPRKTVVTGLIQTNMITKVALQTSDQLESRIILGKSGAEHLLGNGDMIFHKGGPTADIRLQSAFVDENTKRNLAATLPIRDNRPNMTSNNPVYRSDKDIHDAIIAEAREARVKYEREHNITPTPQKKKRVGLIGGLVNLFRVKPIMFMTNNYPPRI